MSNDFQKQSFKDFYIRAVNVLLLFTLLAIYAIPYLWLNPFPLKADPLLHVFGGLLSILGGAAISVRVTKDFSNLLYFFLLPFFTLNLLFVAQYDGLHLAIFSVVAPLAFY